MSEERMPMESKTPNLDALLVRARGIYGPSRLSPSALEVIADAANKDIAAIEARHTEEIARLNFMIDKLRAKIATMVCGTCRGWGFVRDDSHNCAVANKPCPVCQLNEDT